MERQTFGIRLQAALVDLGILVVAWAILAVVFGTTGVAGRLIFGLAVLGYFATEIVKAQSPGKMVMKLKIAKEDGSPADQNVLFTRYALKMAANIVSLLSVLTAMALLNFLAGLIFLVLLVGCFMAMGDARQALHDTIAKTAVFKES
jgi:uncharacterized RDD family membrane protein YckC